MAYNPMSLEGRRVLVTGASSGIGRAVAVCASRLGAEVVLTGRRAEALEETRGLLDGSAKGTCVACDLADPEAAESLVARVTAERPLDGFVHAAGVSPILPLSVLSAAALDAAMRVNHTAFLLLMKALMKRGRFAAPFSSVAVSSVSSEAGWVGGSVYAGTKGALSAAVRSLAIELAPKGVRVNAVCPSVVNTPMHRASAALAGGDDAQVRARQPLGLAEPEQIAQPVCFLLSGAASFVTGENLSVDGGYLAQ